MTSGETNIKDLPQPGMGFIYSLCDPITMEIRYIGQTKRRLLNRLKDHLWPSRLFFKNQKPQTPLSKWITSLFAQGLRPEIKLIEVVNLETIDEREIFYIADGRNRYNLLNLAKGGKIDYRPKGFKLTEKQKGDRKGAGNNAFVNYTGTSFHSLTVIGFVGVIDKISHWSCSCDCGGAIIIGVNKIGRQKSCGCARRKKWDNSRRKEFSNFVNKNKERLPNGQFRTNLSETQKRGLAG